MTVKRLTRPLPSHYPPDGGTRCYQITLPNDDEYVRILHSEIERLAIWSMWDRDPSKLGKPVADVYAEALATFKPCEPDSELCQILIDTFNESGGEADAFLTILAAKVLASCGQLLADQILDLAYGEDYVEPEE